MTTNNETTNVETTNVDITNIEIANIEFHQQSELETALLEGPSGRGAA